MKKINNDKDQAWVSEINEHLFIINKYAPGLKQDIKDYLCLMTKTIQAVLKNETKSHLRLVK
jgi:hypothetical protein